MNRSSSLTSLLKYFETWLRNQKAVAENVRIGACPGSMAEWIER